MWIKGAVQFLHISLSPDFCLTTLLTTSLHMLQGWHTFRKFCIIESHLRPHTSVPSSTLFFPPPGCKQQAPHECQCQPTTLSGLVTHWDELNNPRHGDLKMYTAEWPYIDTVVVAYPSARKLDLNTKQNSFHMPIPLLAPKYVLPQLRNRIVGRPAHSGASRRRDLRLVKFVVSCTGSVHFPGNSANIYSRNALEPSHYIFLVMNVLLYDRILVFMTNDPWHSIAVWSSSVFGRYGWETSIRMLRPLPVHVDHRSSLQKGQQPYPAEIRL